MKSYQTIIMYFKFINQHGMDVVDKINSQPTDKKEMPRENIYLKTIIME